MKHFDVVIVGGGINGCGLLRDLALNGVSTLLIEKGDFSSQTSQGSSKMLHGGIRYLENMDFALVQEALEEKNLWLKLTPHLCFEREFYLPLYTYSKYKPFMLRMGLFLYDFLSHFQNKPRGMLNKSETLSKIPSLEPKLLLASGKYFDGVVDDAKLALECMYDALKEPCASALSYHEVIGTKRTATGYEIRYRALTGEETLVSAKFLVFCTGPFTDKLLPQLGIPWSPQLVPSKGIHLWLKKGAIEAKGSVVLTTKEGRVVFVIPQRGAILVGTTETPVDQDEFNIKANPKDISYLMSVLKEYFPNASLDDSSIISTFAGVRPLVREEGHSESLGKVSRFHKIFRPDSHSYVILGGKYTTFRRMNQELASEIVPRLGKVYHPNLTLNSLRQKSLVPTFKERPDQLSLDLIKTIIKTEKVTTFDDLIKRRLSILENPSDIKTVLGVPVEEVKALFETHRK